MKQLASISLDLDNKWSYLKTHGDSGWKSFPTYLETVVPRVLDLLEKRGLKITFFVVGQDAALDCNRNAILSIAEAGHEIGNHSFNHEPWLHLYSRQELVDELEKAEHAIEAITGTRPAGFRSPGFSVSPAVFELLAERGYEYDCSTLPTYIAPLARAFYLLRSPRLSIEDRARLNGLFGSFSDGFRTLNPHLVTTADRTLVEIPVTTFPFVKTPIHATYLMYLAGYSRAAATSYWRIAMAACRMTGVQPSFLLHPLDFLSGEDVDELKFFPGMQVGSRVKLELLDQFLDVLARDFEPVTVGEHADRFRRERQIYNANVSVERA